jgi:hypothetical protein
MICSKPRLAGVGLAGDALAKGAMAGELNACSAGNCDDPAERKLGSVEEITSVNLQRHGHSATGVASVTTPLPVAVSHFM